MYFSPEVCRLYLPSYLSGPCKAIKEVPKNHQLIVAYIWYHQWLRFPLHIGETLMMPRAAEEGECCSEKRVGNVLYQLFNEGDARQLARCCPISNHAEKNPNISWISTQIQLPQWLHIQGRGGSTGGKIGTSCLFPLIWALFYVTLP